ncbi:class IV adenylate cyclase [bacterium]|nr:class IV adenylate cyclase [bacterium]
MPSNIEIKAWIVGDVDDTHARAAALAGTGPTLIEQEDTFFSVPRGRLKLRDFGDATAELISYERVDAEGPTRSTYSRARVGDLSATKSALAAAFGVRGIVRKRRSLYMVGETRIHIDEVEGLGTFLELEVVLPVDAASATADGGSARCRELMDELCVAEEDLVDVAYIDLLETATR